MNFLLEFFTNLGMSSGVANVISYFISTSINIMLLLLIGIFIFSFIRAKFLDDSLVSKLEDKPKVVVYLGMALLGIISPFCSCSTIPAFVSFVTLGVPTGAAFVYLITSPLIQETSMLLLFTQFGVPVTILYIILGVITGLLAGVIVSRVKDKDIFNADVIKKRNKKNNNAIQEDSCCESNQSSCCTKESTEDTTSKGCGSGGCESSGCGTSVVIDPKQNPVKFALNEAITTLKSTYKYILIGIGFGSFIHGAIPPSLIEGLLGSSNIFSPILATLSGIPIYGDDVALIPVAKSLIDNGAGLGTALSFVMASAVVSIPSFVLLAGVLKKKTILKLASFLTIAIIIIGYLFNALHPILIK